MYVTSIIKNRRSDRSQTSTKESVQVTAQSNVPPKKHTIKNHNIETTTKTGDNDQFLMSGALKHEKSSVSIRQNPFFVADRLTKANAAEPPVAATNAHRVPKSEAVEPQITAANARALRPTRLSDCVPQQQDYSPQREVAKQTGSSSPQSYNEICDDRHLIRHDTWCTMKQRTNRSTDEGQPGFNGATRDMFPEADENRMTPKLPDPLRVKIDKLYHHAEDLRRSQHIIDHLAAGSVADKSTISDHNEVALNSTSRQPTETDAMVASPVTDESPVSNGHSVASNSYISRQRMGADLHRTQHIDQLTTGPAMEETTISNRHHNVTNNSLSRRRVEVDLRSRFKAGRSNSEGRNSDAMHAATLSLNQREQQDPLVSAEIQTGMHNIARDVLVTSAVATEPHLLRTDPLTNAKLITEPHHLGLDPLAKSKLIIGPHHLSMDPLTKVATLVRSHSIRNDLLTKAELVATSHSLARDILTNAALVARSHPLSLDIATKAQLVAKSHTLDCDPLANVGSLKRSCAVSDTGDHFSEPDEGILESGRRSSQERECVGTSHEAERLKKFASKSTPELNRKQAAVDVSEIVDTPCLPAQPPYQNTLTKSSRKYGKSREQTLEGTVIWPTLNKVPEEPQYKRPAPNKPLRWLQRPLRHVTVHQESYPRPCDQSSELIEWRRQLRKVPRVTIAETCFEPNFPHPPRDLPRPLTPRHARGKKTETCTSCYPTAPTPSPPPHPPRKLVTDDLTLPEETRPDRSTPLLTVRRSRDDVKVTPLKPKRKGRLRRGTTADDGPRVSVCEVEKNLNRLESTTSVHRDETPDGVGDSKSLSCSDANRMEVSTSVQVSESHVDRGHTKAPSWNDVNRTDVSTLEPMGKTHSAYGHVESTSCNGLDRMEISTLVQWSETRDNHRHIRAPSGSEADRVGISTSVQVGEIDAAAHGHARSTSCNIDSRMEVSKSLHLSDIHQNQGQSKPPICTDVNRLEISTSVHVDETHINGHHVSPSFNDRKGFILAEDPHIHSPVPVNPATHMCDWKSKYLDLTAEVEQLRAECLCPDAAGDKAADCVTKPEEVNACEQEENLGIEGLTIVMHLRGRDDLVINTHLTQELYE
jgi:hypothetical protein